MVSDRVLHIVWTFHSYFLLLRIIPFLSTWGLPCNYVVQRLACWIPWLGRCWSVLCGHCKFLLLLCHGFGLHYASWRPFCTGSLFLNFIPSIYAWSWPCVAFGRWLYHWLVSVGEEWFPGSFLFGVSFLFSWRHNSAATRRCYCCYLLCWILNLGWWWWCVGRLCNRHHKINLLQTQPCAQHGRGNPLDPQHETGHRSALLVSSIIDFSDFLPLLKTMMMWPFSRPRRHARIMRRCGPEYVLFCSNPVPTLDSFQPSPRLWVPSPH